MTLIGMAVIAAGNKLGLTPGQEAMITGLLGLFLAQSGVNAVFEKLAASKGLGTVLGDLGKLKAAFDAAKAQQAQSAAMATPPAPGAANA